MTPRRAAAAAAAVAVVAVLSVSGADSAAAVGDAINNARDRVESTLDCRTPPPTLTPGDAGAPADIDPGPTQPRLGDPFADPPTSTIYETYNYGGLMWTAYDQGCAAHRLGIRPETIAWETGPANSALRWAEMQVAAANATTRLAADPRDLLATFDPQLERATSVLGDTVLGPFLGLALLALTVLLGFRAYRGDIKATSGRVAVALLLTGAALFIVDYPVRAASTFDDLAVRATSTVMSGLDRVEGSSTGEPGVAAAASLHEWVLWRSWVGGTFGKVSGPTVDAYAGPLFAAATRTVSEHDQVLSGAVDGKSLDGAKQDQWEQIVGEIEQTDPGAYRHLKGDYGDNRLAYAAAANITAFLVAGVQIVANLMFVAALFILRLLVAVFPALVVWGVIRPDVAYGPFVFAGWLLARGIILMIGLQVYVRIVSTLFEGLHPLIAAAIGAAVVVGLAGYRWYRRRHKDRQQPAADPAQPPAADPARGTAEPAASTAASGAATAATTTAAGSAAAAGAAGVAAGIVLQPGPMNESAGALPAAAQHARPMPTGPSAGPLPASPTSPQPAVAPPPNNTAPPALPGTSQAVSALPAPPSAPDATTTSAGDTAAATPSWARPAADTTTNVPAPDTKPPVLTPDVVIHQGRAFELQPDATPVYRPSAGPMNPTGVEGANDA